MIKLWNNFWNKPIEYPKECNRKDWVRFIFQNNDIKLRYKYFIFRLVWWGYGEFIEIQYYNRKYVWRVGLFPLSNIYKDFYRKGRRFA